MDLVDSTRSLRAGLIQRAKPNKFYAIKKTANMDRVTYSSLYFDKEQYKVSILFMMKRGSNVPSLSDHGCKVSCTCMDYANAWWYWNKLRGIHLGDDPELLPPIGLGSPRNKLAAPGLCKHLIGLAGVLENTLM